MTCGHCFTSETINSIVENTLEKEKHKIECPILNCQKKTMGLVIYIESGYVYITRT